MYLSQMDELTAAQKPAQAEARSERDRHSRSDRADAIVATERVS